VKKNDQAEVDGKKLVHDVHVSRSTVHTMILHTDMAYILWVWDGYGD